MSCTATISALVATVWLASTGDPADKSLVIGTADNFPPYMIRDDQDALIGLDHDIMSDICGRAAFDCTWQTAPFNELIPGVIEGRFDVALGGMAITPERRRLVDFSIPYFFAGAVEWFIGFPDAPPPETARIAVEAGTIHEAWLRQQKLDFRSYPSEAAALEAVATGAADLALGPYSTRRDLEPLIEARGLERLDSVEIPDEGTGIAVCKGNDELKAAIDRAISAMKDDGTLDRLNETWF